MTSAEDLESSGTQISSSLSLNYVVTDLEKLNKRSSVYVTVLREFALEADTERRLLKSLNLHPAPPVIDWAKEADNFEKKTGFLDDISLNEYNTSVEAGQFLDILLDIVSAFKRPPVFKRDERNGYTVRLEFQRLYISYSQIHQLQELIINSSVVIGKKM